MKPRIFETGAGLSKDMLPKLERVASPLQVLLMPIAYRANHPELPIDMNDPACKNKVAMEWVEKYAGPFRDYIESPLHQDETIDLRNPEALEEFFRRMEKESPTLH